MPSAGKVYIMAAPTVKNSGGKSDDSAPVRHYGELWRSARCVVLLGLVAFAPLAPSLVGGRVMLPADLLMVMQPFKAHSLELGFRRVSNPMLDAAQQFWPWRTYAGRELRHGVLPLWNPYMLSGTPFVGNNQSAIFYPGTWLFAIMSPAKAFGWAAALYLWASGCFMFFYLRTIGLRRRSAMVGSVAWMWNGFVVGWICLPSFRSVPGWLPLMLAAYERAVRGDESRARTAWLALAALAVGLQFLAGNLHITFYVLLVFSLYAVAIAVREARRGRSWAWPIGVAAAAGLAGGALAAIQLMPTLEFAFRSARQGISYAEVLKYRLAPIQLLPGLMPNLFGNPVDYNDWGTMLGPQYRAYTETAFYTGAFALVLAAVGALGVRRKRVWFWLGIIVLALLLALGTPLDYVLYHLVPGFRQLPGINRAIVMICFAVPVLAAYGAEMLICKRRTQLLGRTAAAVLFVGLAAAVWAWINSASAESQGVVLGPYTWMQYLRFVVVIVVCATLVWLASRRGRPVFWAATIAVMALDSAYFGYHFMPQVPDRYAHPPSQIVSFLQSQSHQADDAGKPFRILSVGPNALDRMPPNIPMLFGLRDVQGSDSITYGRYVKMLDGLSDNSLGFKQPLWEDMAALGVKYIVTPVALATPDDPRLTLERVEPGGNCKLYRVTNPAPMASSGGEPCDAYPLSPNRWRITAGYDHFRSDTVLLRQTCYPGWRAFAAGELPPIAPADHCQQSIETEGGDTPMVDLVFEPTSFKLGCFLTLLAMMLLVTMATMATMRRRTA